MNRIWFRLCRRGAETMKRVKVRYMVPALIRILLESGGSKQLNSTDSA